jgi:3-hydroxybutyryl-CoA dehydrogenase
MKIAVLADGRMRKELQAKINGAEIELIWVDALNDLFQPGEIDAYFDLDFEMKKDRIEMLARLLPKPVFINSVVHTLDGIDQPFVRINAWPTFLKREIAELAIQAGPSADAAKTFLDAVHWQYQIVPDKPGMVSARIIAMIINEAYYTAQNEVSSKEDIDIAMKLGTNYPYGPFEWGKIIGLKNILELLKALRETDDRYTISAMLEKEAREL